MAPAQVFAMNGVRLAYELGCDYLCFGAENSIEELYETLEILDADDTQEKIAVRMQAGCYYPRALSEAVGEPYASIIAQPNNILALEYIRACREYGLIPIAIKREGAGHDSQEVCGNIASATKIRDMIRSGEDVSPFMPEPIKHAYFLEDIETILLFFLKTQKPEETAAIAGISEGLNYRIYKCAQQYNSTEEILSAIKTKRYTMARLRRITLSIVLGITAQMQNRPVPYIRVLGIRNDKSHMIRTRSLPLIVDVRRGYNALNNSDKEIFDIDLEATKLMNSNSRGTLRYPLNEFHYGVIKI